MRYSHALIAVVVSFSFVSSGCHEQDNEAAAPQMAAEQKEPSLHTAASRMADNAAWNDLSISDFHFVRHTSELNGTGTLRLERLSPMLTAYGGTLHYGTKTSDEELINERLAHVHEYLELIGCDMDRTEVIAAMPDGRTIPAARAIEILQRGTAPTGGGQAGGQTAGLPPIQ